MKFTERKIGISTFIFLMLCAIIISSLSTFFILNSKLESSGKTLSQKESLVAKLVKSDELISKRFTGNMPANSVLVDGIINGYINSLNDRYSLYMTKENYRAYNSTDGILDMIGIITSFDGAVDGISVDYVMEKSPAKKGGIRKGDIITKVGGITVTKNNYYVLLNSLMGKKGSEADIQYVRKGEKTDVTLKLDLTAFSPVSSYFFDELGIGVINIGYFNDKTSADFNTFLDALIKKGPAGIIIDIRGNAGGNMASASAVLDRILPKGAYLTEKTKGDASEKPKEYISDDISLDIPLVLLVDDYTKGVAEIFAAVLKDKGYALVGTHTHGKVTSEEVIGLGDETAVMFSSVKYLTAKGGEITGFIEPTVNSELAEDLKLKLPDIDQNLDAQLTEALNRFTATK